MEKNVAATFVKLIPLEELSLVTPAHKMVYLRLEDEYGEEDYQLFRREPSVRMCNCPATKNEPDTSRHHELCLFQEHDILVIRAGEEEVKIHEMYVRESRNEFPVGEDFAAPKDCVVQGSDLTGDEKISEKTLEEGNWCVVVLRFDGTTEVVSGNEVQDMEVDLKNKVWVKGNDQLHNFGEIVLLEDGSRECVLEGRAEWLKELLALQEKLICSHLSFKVAEAFSAYR
ncbi:MAG TPA: hypothetical protein PKA31_00985 [Candidatus Moranbacteria bacterium]|nr:hypothetical protein [Candidatus Moranbacteria bacterium]